jgi:translation initiation factor IF-1
MNIITGINKLPIPSFKFQIKVNELGFRFLTISVISLFLCACSSRQHIQEEEVTAKSDVKISSPIVLPANHLVNYMAVTRYMQANDIRTQVTGIVRQINCVLAGTITAGEPLFIIQPQEAAALQRSKFSSQILNALSDTVFAHISGQVKNLNVQVGDFVQSGDVLASCIRANSMRIIVYIPVERATMVEKFKNCRILLPDGSAIAGHISGKLPSAESQDQTQAYIVEPSKNITLAENINLSVQFTAEQSPDGLFVPESAVLGNEEQTSFWVMKLANDSTCIKVPVSKGLEQDSLVQVLGSGLTISDAVMSEGGYGLADSARVHVVNKK